MKKNLQLRLRQINVYSPTSPYDAAHLSRYVAFLLRVADFEGIFCGASAIYLAMTEVLNEQYGRTVLPISMIKTA